MNKISIGCLLAITAMSIIGAGSVEAQGGLGRGCSWNGIFLSGKVKIVDRNPDLFVKVVEHNPDIKVKVVEHFPNKCGKWQVVDHHPDFTIAIVKQHPAALRVKWENNFPGTR